MDTLGPEDYLRALMLEAGYSEEEIEAEIVALMDSWQWKQAEIQLEEFVKTFSK